MAPKKESRDNYSLNTEGKVNHLCGLTNDQNANISEEDSGDKLAYCVTDVPPWYLCIILGIQHFLTAFGGIIAIPLILSQGLCLQHDGLTQSHLISTIFFVSGICTLLQVTLGVRLPILQGGTFTFLAPTTSLLSMPDWVCPAWTQNATLVNTSSPEFIQVWQSRIQVIQGSIMVGSLFQILVGFSGLIGLFMRFIGPLTIAPTISLIGLSLFDSAGMNAGSHWGISAMTTCIIVLFSQYLRHIAIPLPAYSKAKKFHISKITIFQILPVLLGITVSWLICYLLTIYNVLPSDPKQYGYLARTDIKGDVIGSAPWFRFPYPGQWGLPTVSLAGVLGILAGVITSMVESVGDYHACARLSGAPPPPKHAINRGIGIEGLGCLLAGAWGTGNGTTSYSENVGALGITKTEGKVNHLCGLTNDQNANISEEDSGDKLAYCVTDVPPWYLCIILGIQHFLTAFGGIIAIPLILSQGLCLQHDGLTQSHLISTIFFVSGICTLLQVTLGVRLPILQGGTFTFLAPTTSLLSMPDWVCPAWTQNATLVNTSSPEFIQVWQSRIQVIQGSIMVGSLFQILVGFSGLIGLFMRFIGPLTIAPTISLIGLSLFDSAGMNAGSHWGISAMTTCIIVLFSQYLRHIAIPLPAYSKAKKFHISKITIFQILPVLLGITVSWLICYLLTIYNVLPSDPKQYGYLARTDIKGDVIGSAPWFRFPYPGQWGLPTVSLAGVLGILAGVITSMVESVGDYHACARLSGAPPPPKHAINRGIGIEGLGCLLAGAWGTGNGTTSYSENVGALGITKTEGKVNHLCGLTHDQNADISEEDSGDKLAYCVTDVPPWYLCIILGIQHFLTAFGGIIAIPLILSQGLCLQHDGLTQSHLISTIFFVSGICTLLQVTLGVRLPILQGGTFTFLAPTTSLLSMPDWVCPAWTQNATLVNTSSPEFIQVWQSRIQVIQGSIMVGSLFQILVGFSGLIGLFMRFIGPLTIAPTISLIGLSLFDSAGMNAGSHWGISAMTTCIIVLFSQYLRHIAIPLPAYSKAKKFHISKITIFQILPVLLGITVSWLICYLLTIYNVLPSDPKQYGYLARTDIKGDVIGSAPWFRFPYPGQWGLPTVSLAGVLGILAGVITSMVESVGDYHACARLSGAPPPPKHAINRGIGIEGLGCLLAGAWGTGNGTTSYSENVGALGITKVGSRMVIVASGFIMIIMGLFGKIGAIFSTIPTPVIGGMFLVMFGVIAAVGVSNLQYADMNSSRNIFIFGFSMFTGLAIPNWIIKNPDILNTGIVELNQVLQALLTTSMFVGGFFGFVLDNTVPGTKHERGMSVWNRAHEDESENILESEEVYGLPCAISSCLASYPWVRYIPFCPLYKTRSQNDTTINSISLGKKEPSKDDTHVIVAVAL